MAEESINTTLVGRIMLGSKVLVDSASLRFYGPQETLRGDGAVENGDAVFEGDILGFQPQDTDDLFSLEVTAVNKELGTSKGTIFFNVRWDLS